MQISAVIVLFASAAGVVGQATCATAARPQGPAAQTGLCTGTPDGLVQCGAFDGQAKAFFSPPNGNRAGTLRIRNENQSQRQIIEVRNAQGDGRSFWINAGDECTTNFGFSNLNAYTSWNR
jgi:hypothetical protein